MSVLVRALLACLLALVPLLGPHWSPEKTKTKEPYPAATAESGITCRDGTISHAAHRRGACSHHGGIA
jgi:hypothetical protein